MRNLLFSLVAVGVVAGAVMPIGAQARPIAPVVVVGPAAVETVQYYEPGWREREEWRRRREIEFHRRREIRRHEDWRAFHRPPPPPPGYYLPPPPLPRY